MKAVDKALLKKFLDDDCTAEEARIVQELLRQPEAQEVMQELTLDEWNKTVHPDEKLNSVLKRWKEKVNARITLGEQGKRTIEQAYLPLRRLPILRYAAMLAGIVLLGSITIWQFKKKNDQETVAYVQRTNMQGYPVKCILPDSSQVFLSAGSRLRYPAEFQGNTREIDLQGEAFFQVTRNPSKPFIIHTGEINTIVLGTSFKVQAYNGQPIEVAVATGKVNVSRHTGSQAQTLALLTPGLKLTWNRLTHQASKSRVDIKSLEQWKAGDMVFENQTMEQIAAELQRRYGVKIDIIDTEIASHQVSGTFPAAKTIDKVMQTLEVAGKFRYESKNNKTFKIYKTE
jgi:transmembrane sensor